MAIWGSFSSWNPFNLKGGFQGRTDPFSGALLDRWEGLSEFTPSEGEQFQPWERRLQAEMTPGAGNPAVARWAGATNRRVGDIYGAGSAKTAAATQRTRTAGNLAISKLSPQWYERLMQQALGVQGDRGQIDTTTRQNAFLQGFAQGGGAQATGSAVGGSWRPAQSPSQESWTYSPNDPQERKAAYDYW